LQLLELLRLDFWSLLVRNRTNLRIAWKMWQVFLRKFIHTIHKFNLSVTLAVHIFPYACVNELINIRVR
jgi:hypothetical protein